MYVTLSWRNCGRVQLNSSAPKAETESAYCALLEEAERKRSAEARRNPSLRNIIKIALALGVPVEELSVRRRRNGGPCESTLLPSGSERNEKRPTS